MTASQNVAGQSIAEKQAAFKAMMLQKAGPVGPFAGSEDFPKSYFLIPKNLPFLVLMTLSHPIGEKLNLTDAQKELIMAEKETTVPRVVQDGLQAKKLELEMLERIGKFEDVKNLEPLVREIADLKIALTLEHLRCIDVVRGILGKEKYSKLVEMATAAAA